MKLSECKRYPNNPFHDGSLGSLNLRKFPLQPQGPMVNRDTGEIVTGNVYLHKKYGYLDTRTAIKLFADSAKVLSSLTMPGIKMFFYVVSELHKGEEKVYISPRGALEFTGYRANKDVYKGLVELIELQVLAKSTESLMYFVNPNILFNGNKVNLVDELPNGN